MFQNMQRQQGSSSLHAAATTLPLDMHQIMCQLDSVSIAVRLSMAYIQAEENYILLNERLPTLKDEMLGELLI